MCGTLLVVLVIVFCVAAGGYYLYLYIQSRRVEPESFYRFNCPACGRKLKYKARKRGMPGVCPGCKSPVIFPLSPTEGAYLGDEGD